MVGAVSHLDFVWLVADTLNAFMAFPNLVSLVLLSPVVVKVTNDYFASGPATAVHSPAPAIARAGQATPAKTLSAGVR